MPSGGAPCRRVVVDLLENAWASAIVRAVRPSHRSGASATNPSPASRSQKRRMPSLSPHHACSTSTPGPPPAGAAT